MDFTGKNILITGAGRGLGEALARNFARWQPHLILADRNTDRFPDISASLKETGSSIDWFKCDVTTQADIDGLYSAVKEKYGVVDVLVNNAGILNTHGFGNSNYAEYEKIMNVNVNGYVRMIFTFLPILGRDLDGKNKGQKSGLVITISSMAGVVIPPNLQFYGISKTATRGVAKALRQHFLVNGQKHMKVLNVNPPQFDTQLYVHSDLDQWIVKLRENGKLPTPAAFAAKIVKAAHRGQREVNLSLMGKLGAFGARFFPNMTENMSRVYYHKSQKPLASQS